MQNDYVKLARLAIEYYLNNNFCPSVPKDTNKNLINKKVGVFVTLHNNKSIDENDLRGCIGTIYPTKKNIAEEIINNAVSAAFHDDRFPPLKKDELDRATISVEILSEPEPIQGITSLNPKKYGVIVRSANDERTGLLLPDIDGIETPEYQIALARQKASIMPSEPIYMYRFETTKYSE